MDTGKSLENANSWSARDRSREASNDYYQKNSAVPLTGYTMGTVGTEQDYTDDEKFAAQNSSVYKSLKTDSFTIDQHRDSSNPKDIKVEDSMEGYLGKNNPAYSKEAND